MNKYIDKTEYINLKFLKIRTSNEMRYKIAFKMSDLFNVTRRII